MKPMAFFITILLSLSTFMSTAHSREKAKPSTAEILATLTQKVEAKEMSAAEAYALVLDSTKGIDSEDTKLQILILAAAELEVSAANEVLVRSLEYVKLATLELFKQINVGLLEKGMETVDSGNGLLSLSQYYEVIYTDKEAMISYSKKVLEEKGHSDEVIQLLAVNALRIFDLDALRNLSDTMIAFSLFAVDPEIATKATTAEALGFLKQGALALPIVLGEQLHEVESQLQETVWPKIKD